MVGYVAMIVDVRIVKIALNIVALMAIAPKQFGIFSAIDQMHSTRKLKEPRVAVAKEASK